MSGHTSKKPRTGRFTVGSLAVRKAVKSTPAAIAPETAERFFSVASQAAQPGPMTLQEARASWILGDWDRLLALDQPDLARLADRESLALLAGSAYLQVGDLENGRQLLSQARLWGCPGRLVAQILLAGAHMSLGRAELLREQGHRSHQHVLTAIQSLASHRRDTAGRRAASWPRGRPAMDCIEVVALGDIGARLRSSLAAPAASTRPFDEWEMARDDGPVLRYLWTVQQPKRHLEFGTWQGWGTCLCLETTDAGVWTINLPAGESKADGSWAYAEKASPELARPGVVSVTYGDKFTGPIVYHRTDAGSYVGWMYREKGLGHRVCQIFCDSRDWDVSVYPSNFFDSVFVDGGHQTDVIISDTRKALSVLRPGGMIIWHDFCPEAQASEGSPVVQEVTRVLQALLPEISSLFSCLAWIRPSMVLLGIRK